MFPAILYPFNRPAQPKSRGADQHVFRIKLAAYSEAAADMTFAELKFTGGQTEHFTDGIAIVMRHLGRAINSQNIAIRIEHTQSAAGLHGNAGMTSNFRLQLDHAM